MKKFLLMILALMSFAWSVSAVNVVDGRVVKYPLNVRAGAGTNYNIVGKLTKHNPVRIVAVGKNWLKIAAPANCRVWVMEKFIKNNRFTANVNLRSGPGVGFERVGSGLKGSQVKIGGKATASGWVPIVPPGNVFFYVGLPAIEADAQSLAKLPKFTGSGPRPANKTLCAIESSLTAPVAAVKASGYIYKEGKAPVTHVLFIAGKKDLQPKYFLMPGGKPITVADGEEVQISGDLYKVQNWAMPLIIVKNIRVVK